jgi:glycerol-1-phosphate dehydrogenase [NAD(P)+]
MALIFRNIAIPLFLEIEPGILKRIENVIRNNNLYFRSPLVVADPKTFEVAAESIMNAFSRVGKVDCVIITSNSIQDVIRTRDKIHQNQSDVVIGVGGGRAIDVGKFAASEEKINFISVPTAPSHDGIASPIAVIRENDHLKRYGAKMALGVIVDLEVIKHAPIETIYSGFGDLISNISAIEDWIIADKMGKDKFDSFAAALAATATQAIMNEPMSLTDLLSIDFLKRLVTGLVMSGIAMSIAGSSRPCSGAEHLISHALDQLLPTPQPHGIQVGIATIFTSALQGSSWRKLKSLYRNIGFPTMPEAGKIPNEIFLKAVEMAPAMRNERFTILNKIGKERYLEIFDKVFLNGQFKKEEKRLWSKREPQSEKREKTSISDLADTLAI